MVTVKIEKFAPERRYTAETSFCWFELIEREGKELTFKVTPANRSSASEIVKATAVVTSYKNKFFEEARVSNREGSHTINACTWVSRGRRVSEMSKEDAERVMTAIREDVERRKRNGED